MTQDSRSAREALDSFITWRVNRGAERELRALIDDAIEETERARPVEDLYALADAVETLAKGDGPEAFPRWNGWEILDRIKARRECIAVEDGETRLELDPAGVEIIFFPNGNTAALAFGGQLPTLQSAWILCYVRDAIKRCEVDATRFSFRLPNGSRARVFRTAAGYNWEVE